MKTRANLATLTLLGLILLGACDTVRQPRVVMFPDGHHGFAFYAAASVWGGWRGDTADDVIRTYLNDYRLCDQGYQLMGRREVPSTTEGLTMVEITVKCTSEAAAQEHAAHHT